MTAGVQDRARHGGHAGGAVWLMVSAAVSGVAGYLALWLVAAAEGPEEYGVFGVFWSALFLVVGILSGLQQETTRSTAAVVAGIDAGPVRSSWWLFGAGVGGFVALVVALTGLWWAPLAFGDKNSGLLVQVALGSAANAMFAVFVGLLSGGARWRIVATVLALDGLVRLAAIVVVVVAGGGQSQLAWAVVLPFPLTLLAILLGTRGLAIRLGRSPLGAATMAGNTFHTMLAAAATAVLVNGFPLLLGLGAGSDDAALLGALIFAITVTRAPILLPITALQGFLIARMTADPRGRTRIGVLAGLLVAAVGAVLSVLVALLGPWALREYVGPGFELPALILALLVASSAAIGLLAVSGAVLLAAGRRRAYAAGWCVASLAAIVGLFLPLELDVRAVLALSFGPVAGLVTHAAFIAVDRRRARTS